MVDQAKLAATALRLITKNGRSITFVNQDGVSVDPLKPWKSAASPIGGGITFVTVGAFVPPNTIRGFGLSSLGEGSGFEDFVSMSEQIIIVSPGETVDLREFHDVLDRGSYWGITGVQILRPGSLVLLGFVGVKR